MRPSYRRTTRLLALATATIGPLLAQCQYYLTPIPSVLLSDGSNTVRIEVSGGSTATGIHWQLPAQTPLVVRGSTPCPTQTVELDFKDDGTQGDRIAGDKIFTIDNIRYRTAAEGICANGLLRQANQPDGYNDLRLGVFTVQAPSGNVTLDATSNFITFHVMAPENLRLLDEVTSVSSTRQESAYIINVRDDALTLERGMTNLPANGVNNITAAATLTSFLPDNYDFRAVVSTTQTMCNQRVSGMHLNVRNRATGLGTMARELFNDLQSGPNLQGVSFIAWQGIGANAVFNHETMHQWSAFLPTSLGLSDQTGHWLQSTTVNGATGGCYWSDNGNGTFTITSTWRPTGDDGDLELYLAGFIPAEQIKPILIANNTGQNFCGVGTVVQGPFRTVTYQDIINAAGRRSPGPESSQKNFKQATIVTTANRLLTPLEMTFYARIAQTWEGYTVETGTEPPLQWPKYTRGLSTLNLKLDSYTGPFIRAAGLVNGASAAGNKVAPGQIAVLYGLNLGPTALVSLALDADGNVAKQLAGTRVWFDEFPAPMIYTSSGQISAVVPYGISGRRMVSVQAEYQGRRSNAVAMAVVAANPAIFTLNLTGSGPGAILNQDNSVNSATNPAPRGSVVQVYATGEGLTNPAGVDGRVNTSVFPTPTLNVFATIDGQISRVPYRGAAPFSITGLFQVNVEVPPTSRSGAVPIQIRVGPFSSPDGVTVYVQ
ncbi:MAG: hypothetical protein RL328_1220 [Acidobacteriota bacterium]